MWREANSGKPINTSYNTISSMGLYFKEDKVKIKCPSCGGLAVPNREIISEGVDHFLCLDCGVQTSKFWKSQIEHYQLPEFKRKKADKRFRREIEKEVNIRKIEKADLLEETGYNDEEEKHLEQQEQNNKSCCKSSGQTISSSNWTGSSPGYLSLTTSG